MHAIFKGLKLSYARIINAYFLNNEPYASISIHTKEKKLRPDIYLLASDACLYSGTFEHDIFFCDHVRHLGIFVSSVSPARPII